MPHPTTLEVGSLSLAPGQSGRVEIPVARLPTQTHLSLPVVAVNGRRPGPRVWLSAAVHGDEINGVEIIRRVLTQIRPETLRGSLIAVPIVNVFGFINESRYLPDRRDLNRSFPGSAKGSLAARLARIFMDEVVEQCQVGIDLHTAGKDRTNLPQIRADLDDKETRRCALAFGTPVVIHSRTRDGSLREAATRRGIRVLLFEGGEPNRFNEEVIVAGARGVLRVFNALGMMSGKRAASPQPLESRSSGWVRARRAGLFHLHARLGDHVQVRQPLGLITDSFAETEIPVRAPRPGIVIGATLNPLVNQGDALVHIASVPARA